MLAPPLPPDERERCLYLISSSPKNLLNRSAATSSWGLKNALVAQPPNIALVVFSP